jgi:hypothetical protein
MVISGCIYSWGGTFETVTSPRREEQHVGQEILELWSSGAAMHPYPIRKNALMRHHLPSQRTAIWVSITCWSLSTRVGSRRQLGTIAETCQRETVWLRDFHVLPCT